MEITIEQSLQQGITAHEEGRLEDAERLYRAILQSQPAHPDANHNLGLLAVSVNKADVALPLFKTALEANPKIERFWLSYIDAHIKENQLETANAVLEQGRKMGLVGDKVDVLEVQLKQITESAPPKLPEKKKSLTRKEKRKRITESKQQKKQAKDKSANAISPSQSQLDNLLEHYQNARYDEAEKLAVTITQQFPRHPFGWKVLGAVLKQCGRVSESLIAKQNAVQLSPQDAVAHNNLGNALIELGRLDEAEASYRQAIALKPDFAEAHNNLGNTLQELGRLDEALASYTQAIALKPDYAEAHSNLGVMLQGLGRLDEAEASYTQAIALKPDYAEAHYNLGITLQKLGRLDEAEASYTQLIALKPDHAKAYSNLGVTLKELGRLDQAKECLKHAIELEPDFVQARVNLNAVAMSAVPSWHLPMMNDEVRNNAYYNAIKLAVGDGALVLDIGTGSGLLSLMAAANGAGKVITCETSRVIADAAKDIIDSNGYGEKISVVNKMSTDLIVGEDLPQRADLIISEVLSAELVGEGVRTTLFDANKRLLKKNGTMIPQSGKIIIALVGNSPEVFDATSVASVHGFDLSRFNLISQNKFYPNLKDKPLLLSSPEEAFNINFYNESGVVKEERIIRLQADQDGLCLGLIQWLSVHLYKHIEYENRPGENHSHWATPVYLFDEPIALKTGDVVHIRAILSEDRVWFYQKM